MLVSDTIRACRRTRSPIVNGRGVSISLENGTSRSVQLGNKRSGPCTNGLGRDVIKVLIWGKLSSLTCADKGVIVLACY
jgi:hypothetical protein